jgi:hypothetical protein
MGLEDALNHIIELSHEELRILRKRAEEKTAARDHGHDFHEMRDAADRLDHYAAIVRALHDNEFSGNWRVHSARAVDRP